MVHDNYVGKVLLVKIPGIERSRYRWIVRKREDNRYIVRTPKIGVRISDLHLLRDNDYGKETLLPIYSKIQKSNKS